MALSREDLDLIQSREVDLSTSGAADTRNDRYYEGSQRLDQIGIAVPPELRRFETMVNWCRTVVDTVSNRQRMKTFYMPGEEIASAELREGWDANNLDSESRLLQKEKLILGRGFVSVGTNEEDREHPLIQVESPREMSVAINARHRRLDAAVRLYGGASMPQFATVYRPDYTVWAERTSSGWVEYDRDPHRLGRVPIIMFINRRRLGRWSGVSEMADVIPLVDAAARSLTNLQVAGETHSVPQKYVLGMSKGDFVDAQGQPIPAWQAYYNAIWATGNKDAKVGQFSASDLSNFHDTVNHYAQQVAGLTGLPVRYFGQNTANPPSEGGLIADESRLIQSVEAKNTEDGDGWGWVAGLYHRFATGEWVDGSRIKTEWYNPATPTVAQTSDAMSKLYANGTGPISRETVWDELGWSEARKKREKTRIQQEQREALTVLEKDVEGAL